MSASLGRALRSVTRRTGSASVPRTSLNNAEREKINAILLAMIPENVKRYGIANSRGGTIGKRKIVRSRLSNISNEEKKRILNTYYTLSPLRPSKIARAVTYTLNKFKVSAAAPGQMLNVKQLAQIFLTEEQKPAIKRLLVQSGYSKNEGEAIANAANKVISNKAGNNRRQAATKLSHVVFDYLMLPGNSTARGENIKGGLWNFAVEKLGNERWFKVGVKFANVAKMHPRKTKAGAALAVAYIGHAVGTKAVGNTVRVVKGTARATKHVVTQHPRKIGAAVVLLIAQKLWSKFRGQRRNKTPSPARPKTPSPTRPKTPSPTRPKTPSPSPRRLSPVQSYSSNSNSGNLFLARAH